MSSLDVEGSIEGREGHSRIDLSIGGEREKEGLASRLLAWVCGEDSRVGSMDSRREG